MRKHLLFWRHPRLVAVLLSVTTAARASSASAAHSVHMPLPTGTLGDRVGRDRPGQASTRS